MPNPPKTKPPVIDRKQYADILSKPITGGVNNILFDKNPSAIDYANLGHQRVSGSIASGDLITKKGNEYFLYNKNNSGQGLVSIGSINPGKNTETVTTKIVAPLAKNNTPNPIVADRKTIEFGTAGAYNPNTGLLTKSTGYNEPIIPITEQYKKGGLIGKMKGYADGGEISDEENQFKNLSGQNAAISGLTTTALNAVVPGSGTAYGALMGIKDAAVGNMTEIDPATGKYKDKRKALNAGLINSFANMSPAGLAQTALDPNKSFGEKALSIGTLGVSDLFNNKKNINNIEKDNVDIINKQKQQEEKNRLNLIQQTNLNKQLAERNASYANGGKITGKGTGKSDSIVAKVKQDSFVVPSENAEKAEIIRKVVLKAPVKKANLNQAGGEKVKLSNGEHLFTPLEVEEIKNKGINVEALAPESAVPEDPDDLQQDKMKKGGLTPGKARMILHDKEVKGHPLTEKQRKFFGYMSNKKDGGLIGYAEGGEIGDDGIPSYIDPAKVVAGKRTQDLKRRSDLIALREKILSDKNPANKYYNESVLKDADSKIKQLNSIYGDPTPSNSASKSVSLKASKNSSVNSRNTGVSGVKNNINQKSDNTDSKIDYLSSVTPSLIQPNVDRYGDAVEPQLYMNRTPEETMAYNASSTPSLNTTSQPSNFNLGNIGSGLINYGLPIAQAAYGLSALKKLGKRPVGELDPDYLKAIEGTRANVDLANANAKFGFTPEEQALINNQNASQTNIGRYNARNLSGGSAANAYNMERGVINDSFGRGLQAAIQNRNLMLQKQGIAADKQAQLNSMIANKANMSRTLFNDKMNAFQQNQQAAAGLLGSGISNLIGANRYDRELNAMKQANGIENSWMNNLGQ